MMKKVMYNAMDVAKSIIQYYNKQYDNYGIDGLKLQKVLFLLQGCYYFFCGRPLFCDDFLAWGCGPSIPIISERFVHHYGSLWIPDYAIQYDINKEFEPQDLLDFGVKKWKNPISREDQEIIDYIGSLFKDVSSSLLLRYIRMYFPCFVERESKNNDLIIPKYCIRDDFANMVTQLQTKQRHRDIKAKQE